ncbi:hypothetical protein [Halobaculum rarum]|uniref:hypothetical protein n=1 Tax=Halobaculum rarum TaxID=3075122 RepID=UPI0032AF825C
MSRSDSATSTPMRTYPPPNLREGDTVRYVSQGMICAGRVIERSGDILAVDGIAEETIALGQVLTVVTRVTARTEADT